MEDTTDSSDIVKVYSQLSCSSFNADGSCACIGTNNAFAVYNCNPATKRFKTSGLGGLRIVELHYSSSLIACVPSGDVPGVSPRKLILFDCVQNSKLTDLAFPSTVMHCQMNTEILAVSLDDEVFVYDIWTLNLIKKIPCEKGGNISLCTGSVSLLAVPQPHGVVSMYSCTKDSIKSVCENIQAHKSKIFQCKISSSGKFLATCSTTGTIIRIFSLPSGQFYGSFRRGFHHAEVFSISFCSNDEYLAVGSSSGTVHIFSMKSFVMSSSEKPLSVIDRRAEPDAENEFDLPTSSKAPSTTSRFLQSAFGSISSLATEVVRHSKDIREAIDPIRAEYMIRVPGRESKFKVIMENQSPSRGGDEPPRVFVLTDGGFLYRFRIPTELNGNSTQNSNSAEAILCIQEEEHNLLDM